MSTACAQVMCDFVFWSCYFGTDRANAACLDIPACKMHKKSQTVSIHDIFSNPDLETNPIEKTFKHYVRHFSRRTAPGIRSTKRRMLAEVRL